VVLPVIPVLFLFRFSCSLLLSAAAGVDPTFGSLVAVRSIMRRLTPVVRVAGSTGLFSVSLVQFIRSSCLLLLYWRLTPVMCAGSDRSFGFSSLAQFNRFSCCFRNRADSRVLIFRFTPALRIIPMATIALSVSLYLVQFILQMPMVMLTLLAHFVDPFVPVSTGSSVQCRVPLPSLRDSSCIFGGTSSLSINRIVAPVSTGLLSCLLALSVVEAKPPLYAVGAHRSP
jgi:hypothetical protein